MGRAGGVGWGVFVQAARTTREAVKDCSTFSASLICGNFISIFMAVALPFVLV